MPRQDSTTDQINDVAANAEQAGLLTVAAWLRGKGAMPSVDEAWKGRKIAIGLGCYDADDWMRSQMPSGVKVH